mgnify:FL=1
MADPPVIYHYSSLTEPLNNEYILNLRMDFLPFLLDAIQRNWTSQKPEATLKRIYGIINGNGTFTITIETSFKNECLKKEIEFSVAYTPYAYELYETEPEQNFTQTLLFEYQKNVKLLSN